jgi:hypothetical protein
LQTGLTEAVKTPLKATELPAVNVEFALNVARLAALLALEPSPLPAPFWVTQYVVGGGIIAVEEPLVPAPGVDQFPVLSR